MFHSELLAANARLLTEQRVREMADVRAALKARTELRARRREERRRGGLLRTRRRYGRAA
ncbi:hypothetical protein ACIRPH_22060 [Nocardiopsis sp. NPDC101807]|uniref:hypothetical protein n=1 Tax=Nocardiopsis sp. NPDC101807 TaxID=3364339 RepID=UPI0037FCBC69